MLIKILRLFGLDVPAKLEAAKAAIESRVEQATDRVRQVAQEAAVVAALCVGAAIAAALTLCVGLVAVYQWASDAYGTYVGLAVVGAILLSTAIVCAVAAIIRSRSFSANRVGIPNSAGAPAHDAIAVRAGNEVPAAALYPPYSSTSPPRSTPERPLTAAQDLIEPLAFLLSKYLRYPTIGHPVLDDLVGHLKANAHGTMEETVERAARVVQEGDRKNLFVVLTGAAFIGWLLSHHARQHV